jgi:hypothetical protein
MFISDLAQASPHVGMRIAESKKCEIANPQDILILDSLLPG